MHGELRRLVLLVLRRARFVRFGPSGTLGPVGSSSSTDGWYERVRRQVTAAAQHSANAHGGMP